MRQSQKMYRIQPEEMAGTDDELGFGDAKEDAPVRHFIDYSGVKGPVIIPQALRGYNSFIENQSRRRISFRVGNGTSYRKAFSTVRYSTDPQIQQFNRIFSEANRNIDYKGLKTYDAIDYDTANKEGFTSLATVANNVKTIVAKDVIEKPVQTAGGLITLLLYGGAAYVAVKVISGNGNRIKERR